MPYNVRIELADLKKKKLEKLFKIPDDEQEESDVIELEKLNLEIKCLTMGRREIFYPPVGKVSRDKYPKHIGTMFAGASYKERFMMSANRIGKTESVGLFEAVLHLTGDYPEWWEGKRFNRPVIAWICGKSTKSVRQSIQKKLMEYEGITGTGLLTADEIHHYTKNSGTADSIDTIYVNRVDGGLSTATLKSYEQGRESFEAAEVDFILLDEEPDADIYSECLTRTMTTKGILLSTFTPLKGRTPMVMRVLGGDSADAVANDNKYLSVVTWDDVPHLSEEDKQALLSSYNSHERDARSRGIPSLGSGAIYTTSIDDIQVDPFEIPDFWPRVYGLDVGWNRTAAIFGALNPDEDILYLFSEHYEGHQEPVVHSDAIKSRGAWIPGVIDPASRGRNQKDGTRLLTIYREHGLILSMAENSVNSGIYMVDQRLISGRLKIFKTCKNWLFEYGIYRRDDHGTIVKTNDHLMDATRYLCVSGLQLAKAKPQTTDNLFFDTKVIHFYQRAKV